MLVSENGWSPGKVHYTGLLGEEKTVALLQGDTVAAKDVSPQSFLLGRTEEYATTYREYLSSGEKRAGWADLVTWPSWTCDRRN